MEVGNLFSDLENHIIDISHAHTVQNNAKIIFSHGRGTKKRAWPATPKLGPNNSRTPAKSFLIDPLMMNHK